MKFTTKDMVKASIFLALGLLIPYVFHLTGLPGPIFLPMHIPVLLCGFLMGPQYGLMIGFITPLLNAFLTGMPPLYPVGISMAFELATYGFTAGWLYKNRRMNVFVSLIAAMLLGRVIAGTANYIILGFAGKKYVFQMFLMSAFVKAIWGIIIQLALIPVTVKAIEKWEGKVSLNG